MKVCPTTTSAAVPSASFAAVWAGDGANLEYLLNQSCATVAAPVSALCGVVESVILAIMLWYLLGLDKNWIEWPTYLQALNDNDAAAMLHLYGSALPGVVERASVM